MFIEIDMESEQPIYTQLMNGLIEAIANGNLKAGSNLPSVRSLASDLGINMHTVNKTYRELEKKGLVQIIPKSGTVVQQKTADENTLRQLNEQLRPVIAEMLASGLTAAQIKELASNAVAMIQEGDE